VNRRADLGSSVAVSHIGNEEGTKRTIGKLGYLANITRVKGIVEEFSPDLLIGYRIASYGYLAAKIGFHPLALAAQGAYIVSPPYSIPKRMFAKTAIRSADLINSWAPHMTKRLVSLGADPAKVLTCPRGIDLELFAPRTDGRECKFTVISTRTLHRSYGVDVVVKAVAIAAKEVPSISARIVGGGEAEDELRDLARRLGIGERVRFEGKVEYARLPELLDRSDVYVSPVWTDGVSASLLEAMARGCFPVVADNPANRHWIEDGKNGFLVKKIAPASYARAIVSAVRNEGVRRKAERENRAIVEERGNLATNMRRIEAAYHELIDSSGPRSFHSYPAVEPEAGGGSPGPGGGCGSSEPRVAEPGRRAGCAARKVGQHR
jgi:glycosyltransferase involved in cell wall biosynthesis